MRADAIETASSPISDATILATAMGGKYKLHLIFFFGADERQQHNQRLFELIFYHLC